MSDKYQSVYKTIVSCLEQQSTKSHFKSATLGDLLKIANTKNCPNLSNWLVYSLKRNPNIAWENSEEGILFRFIFNKR